MRNEEELMLAAGFSVVTAGSWLCSSRDVTAEIRVSKSFIGSLSDAANQHSRYLGLWNDF